MGTYTAARSRHHSPRFRANEQPHGPATVDISAGQVLEAVAGGLAPATAGTDAYVGIAATDASAGQPVAYWQGGVHALVGTETLAEGTLVACGENGTVVEAETGTGIGVVVGTYTADGTLHRLVRLR